MTSSHTDRLQQLGIELPEVVAPLANYVPASRTGKLVFTAGQLPMAEGQLHTAGKVGDTVSVEDAAALARLCALNALAAVATVADINDIVKIVRVVGYVNGAEGFINQPAVVNGASDVLGDIFGDNGRHARSAVGVAELPLNAPVEIELTVELA